MLVLTNLFVKRFYECFLFFIRIVYVLYKLVDIDDCCSVVLYEFGDIVDCCWVTFADCHFFTQLFFLFMGGIGEFFEIRIFYPVKLSELQYSLGEFF